MVKFRAGCWAINCFAIHGFPEINMNGPMILLGILRNDELPVQGDVGSVLYEDFSSAFFGGRLAKGNAVGKSLRGGVNILVDQL